MKLYFYCSFSSLFEYLTFNKIVCNEYLSRKKRNTISSLGLASDKYLFLTQKKLDAETRKKGFNQENYEKGVILEISVSKEDAKDIYGLVINESGSISEDYISLAELPEKYMGIFILGEISFTFITKIIFNSDDEKNDFYRPSNDIYFPDHLYDVVDDSYMDTLDENLIYNIAQKLDQKIKDIDIVSTIIKRNKVTAITLNIIIETKEWSFGNDYIANFDGITRKILGISEEKINEISDGLYDKIKDKEFKDEILEKINDEREVQSLVPFFRALIRELMLFTEDEFTNQKFSEINSNVLKSISKIYSKNEYNYIKNRIEDIKELVYGCSKSTVESLVAELSSEQDAVLQALIFFLRNPRSELKLSEGLEAYKVNPAVCRYAWIIFSALNGVEPISYEKTKNLYLMKIAESTAMQKFKEDYFINKISSECIADDTFKPIIKEKDILEELGNLLKSKAYEQNIESLMESINDHNELSEYIKIENYYKIENLYRELFDIIPKDKDWITISEMKKIEKKIKDISKKVKSNKKIKYDTKEFVRKWIKNKKNFESLYEKGKEFWKNVYKNGMKR